MVRLAARLLVLVLAVLGLAVTAPSYGAEPAADPGTITQYDSDYTVGADGSVRVVETFAVTFPSPRHGIFRTFDRAAIRPTPPLPNRRSVAVTRDGKPEPASISSSRRGFKVEIGDPAVTLTGVHLYRITYTVTDAVQAGDDEGVPFSEFFWETIGAAWTMPIRASRLTVHLPGRATSGSCGIGIGETGACGGVGTDTLTYETGRIEPRTGVTVRADYSAGDEAVEDFPWRIVLVGLPTSALPAGLGVSAIFALIGIVVA